MKNYVKQLILAVIVFIEQLVLRVYLQVFARFNVFVWDENWQTKFLNNKFPISFFNHPILILTL